MCRTLGLWPTGFSEPFPTHVLETMSGSPDIERGEEYKPSDQSDAIAEESEALLAEETVKGNNTRTYRDDTDPRTSRSCYAGVTSLKFNSSSDF